MFNFYVDDTIIYCCALTLAEAFLNLQTAFNAVQLFKYLM